MELEDDKKNIINFVFVSGEECINHFQFMKFVKDEEKPNYYIVNPDIVENEEMLFYNHYKYIKEKDEDEERRYSRILKAEYGKAGKVMCKYFTKKFINCDLERRYN